MREHQLEALTRAVNDAKVKGEHLAKLSGFKSALVRKIEIKSEQQQMFVTSIVPVVGSASPSTPKHDSSEAKGEKKGRSNVSLVALQQDDRKDGDENKQFALGLIEVSADVEVEFWLR
jgi:uncharacterized protein YggE